MGEDMGGDGVQQWGGEEEIQGEDKIGTWNKINGEGENNMG